jgi:glutaredoxin
MAKLRATIIGRPACVCCQDAERILADKGYEVAVQDVDKDSEAMALFSLLDGDPENLPVVILRGVPPGNL